MPVFVGSELQGAELQTGLQDTDLERELHRRQRRQEGAAVQRWRWLFVLYIGVAVAALSMLINTAIAGLNAVKIRATEQAIYSTGKPPMPQASHQLLTNCISPGPS